MNSDRTVSRLTLQPSQQSVVNMSEPSGKRLKTGFPICKTHKAIPGSRAKQNFPAVVEESLCGVTTFVMELAYRLEALARIFEQDDHALPHVAAFFHRESEREQARAEAMMEYLSERGGRYCSQDIQRPGCESIGTLLETLELMLAQWKEAEGLMVELVQCARERGDPHTASVVKSRFLRPLVPCVKMLGDLLTNARRVGCTPQGTGGLGEYLFDRLQEELSA